MSMVTIVRLLTYLMVHSSQANVSHRDYSYRLVTSLAYTHPPASSTGGQGVLGEDRNARASLTQAASMTPGADALGPGLDYLISCAYSPRTSELLLLAGNNQGAVGCFPVAEPSAPGGTCTFAGAKALLAGGHSSVSTHVCSL